MPGPETNSKVNVYNLGELGVNLTKSPIHIDDGELVAAQNAEFYLDEGLGALRKRIGLQRLNPVALAGAIRGMIGVPLPGPGRRAVYSGERGLFQFYKTTDGTTWTLESTIGQEIGITGNIAGNDQPIPLTALTAQQFFYVGETTTDQSLLMGHDGVAPYELARFATTGLLGILCVHDGDIYVRDYSLGDTSVWQIDPIAGTQTKIGGTFVGERVCSGASYLGKVWVGTDGAKIYWCRPGGTAWTLDHTAGAGQHNYVSLAVYEGNLYAGTAATAGTAAIVEKRTPGGTWTVDRTGSSSANANKFDGLAVFQAQLYADYERCDATFPSGLCQIQKRTSGGVWSVDKDLSGAAAEYVTGRLAVGNTLFYGTTQGAAAGVWSKVGAAGSWTRVNAHPAGVMGVL
jgi:hypothetical protein